MVITMFFLYYFFNLNNTGVILRVNRPAIIISAIEFVVKMVAISVLPPAV